MKKTASTLILLLVLASFCYLHVKEAHAQTTSWTSGFETGDTSEWDGYANSPDIHGDYNHTGSYGMKCDSDTAGAGDSVNTTIPSEAVYRWNCTFWFQLKNDFLLNDVLGIFDVWSPSDRSILVMFSCDGTGNDLYCYSGAEFCTFDSLANDTWHKLEIFSVLNENTTFQLNGAGAQTLNSTAYVWSMMRWGCRWRGSDSGLDIDIWFDDFEVISYEGSYYFNFNFYDVDTADVEAYLVWTLWNSTHDLGYTEGEVSLYAGTYYLNTSKYGHLINTTTLDTATYGNTTININLNMKRHQSCSNGFIVSNDTISSITVNTETPQLLDFTMQGTPPDQHSVGVGKNASYILRDGSNMTDWTYQNSPSHIYWDQPDGDETLLDSYSEANQNNENLFRYEYPALEWYCAWGQTFTTPASSQYKLTLAKFYLKLTVSEEGVKLFARLYAVSAGIPSGDPLAESDEIDIGDVGGSLSLITFSFSGDQQYLLDVSTSYAITVMMRNTIGTARLNVGSDDSSPTHSGDILHWSCYGVWFKQTDEDAIFYVYGQKVEHNFVFVFPSSDTPVIGPNPSPSRHRLLVRVKLRGQTVKGSLVSVLGGPNNIDEWGITDFVGETTFRVNTGNYQIFAEYQEYAKMVSLRVEKATDITIDFSGVDLVSDKERVTPFEYFRLPELNLTTETLLMLIIPLIVLVVYAVKKVAEGPKSKTKYSYLGQ